MKNYSIDPALISLERFKWLTGKKRILPGRVMLQEEMDSRFMILKESGMLHLGDLLRMLGSKSKIKAFAESSKLPSDYLVLLKREAGSYLARPFPLSKFPGIPFEYTEILKSRGISNTKNFFEQMQMKEHQKELSEQTGIPTYRLEELHSLCDLSRITGIGGVFARVVYQAGIQSAEAFAQTDSSTQLIQYKAIIKKYGYKAGDFGEDDLSYCIDYAREVVTCDKKAALK